MQHKNSFLRSFSFLFLLSCLLAGLAGSINVPVSAAPLMQTGTADLSLTMGVNNAAPNKADLVIFTITVTNLSTTDIATGVTVQDVLPAGVTYVSDSSGGTYNSSSGNWVVGTIGTSGSVTLNITTNVTTAGTKTNSATITASSPTDPITNNNTDSRDVTPLAADLKLIMTVDKLTPSLGDIVVISISVTNETLAGYPGASNASGVRVNDILPSGLNYISYTSSSGTYTSSTGNWSVGTLDIGATKTLDITASVVTTNNITNSTEVTLADQLDPDSTPANGIPSEDDYGSKSLNAPSADVALTMAVNNTTPNKADDVVFTITVTNNGTASATGLTVKDLLPAGLAYQSDDGGGTYSSGTGVWLVGSLPVGSSDILKITTRATTTGAKLNTASVLTSNQADPTTANNSASITITPKSADLSITKTVDKNAPVPGDLVKFTITLNNTGPDTATGVKVYDPLPAGYTYSVDDSNGTTNGTYTPGTGIWDVGSINSGATKILNITTIAQANPNKTNKVEVSDSEQLDPDSIPGNNSNSEDDDDAAPKADLSLTKTVNTSVPSMGSNIVFTLQVSNAGPAAATGVVVKDVLKPGLLYVSNNGGATYDSTTSTVLWTVGTLAVGASKTLTITANAAAIGATSNYAEIFASEQYDIDSVPGDGSTTADDDETVLISVSYPKMSILINEVAWAGTSASTNDEWIELYNPGSMPITLTGWILKAVDGTPTINLLSGYVLQPGEYFLLERTDDTTVSDITANQIFTGDIGNSNEILQLIDPLNQVVDTANSNGGNWPAGSSSTFGSMERRGVMTDSDTAWITNTGVVAWGMDAGIPNDCIAKPPCLTAPKKLKGTPKGANWATTVQPTPSPVAPVYHTPTAIPPAPPPPPPLVGINEFVPRPGHDWNNDGFINTGDEYIELINHGVVDVNLSGYRLDDEANVGSNPFSLPSVILKPGDRIVFYGSQTGLILSDGGDGVRLLKPNGQLMDAYNYSVVEFPDQSYCRLPDNGGLDDWNTNCYPTPGLRNSLSGSMLRPPTEDNEDQPLCPIADILPQGFYLAECTPFGNNIWNRYYWDKLGWFGERDLPNVDGKWEVLGY